MNNNCLSCTLCPLECCVDRSKTCGACGVGGFDAVELSGADPNETAKIARAARHYFEEPPISGKNGSGAIFFSGCNLRCVFCQNMDISSRQKGKLTDAVSLAEMMLRLEQLGSHNINLVTPSVHIELLKKAIPLARRWGLNIPIVYNTNAYEKVETLKSIEGLVDIYLPDLKYVSCEAAKKYSGRADYFEFASKAVLEMQRQCGVLAVGEDGIAKKGVLVRHLVLPGSVDEARGVMDFIHNNMPIETHISIMSQYTPMCELPAPLNRRILKREYDRAVDYAMGLGFKNIWLQGLSSANSAFTPAFDNYFE